MIYTTQRGESFDLEKDFSSPERHILQKLFIWKDMAASVEEFRLKKREALSKGWGDSGPIQASRNLESITRDFEAQVALRVRRRNRARGEGDKSERVYLRCAGRTWVYLNNSGRTAMKTWLGYS